MSEFRGAELVSATHEPEPDGPAVIPDGDGFTGVTAVPGLIAGSSPLRGIAPGGATDGPADRGLAALRRTPATGAVHDHGAIPNDAVAPVIRRWNWPWESKSKAKPKPPSSVAITPTSETTTDTPTPAIGEDTAPVELAVNYPRVATVGTEQVQVESKQEEDEANRIVKELKDTYEIDLSSTTTIAGIKKGYPSVPKSVTDKLTVAVWSIRELRALEEAATFYAPILGAQRQQSSKKGSFQGVTTIGKLKNAIDKNTKGGKLDSSTLGEYFDDEKNIGLFSKGTNHKDTNFVRPGEKKTDVQTSLTSTAIHEMAHALVQPRELTGWVSTLDFWTDRNTKSGKRKAETPPTSYGRTNAAEDLCESVAMFFINRAELKQKCPEREKFIEKVVAAWAPQTVTAVVDTAVASPGSETPPTTTDEQP